MGPELSGKRAANPNQTREITTLPPLLLLDPAAAAGAALLREFTFIPETLSLLTEFDEPGGSSRDEKSHVRTYRRGGGGVYTHERDGGEKSERAACEIEN